VTPGRKLLLPLPGASPLLPVTLIVLVLAVALFCWRGPRGVDRTDVSGTTP